MNIGHAQLAMDQLEKLNLAMDQLAKLKCVYHQDFMTHSKPHLRVDQLGAGDFVFVPVPPDFPNTNPSHSYTNDGLLLSIERPVDHGNMGEFGAARMQGVHLPHNFLLVASFRHPSQVSLVAAPPSGTHAPAILIFYTTGKFMGASCQFTAQGVHLHLTGTGTPARPNIPQSDVDRILAGATLSLAFWVSRTASASSVRGTLYINNKEIDSDGVETPKFTISTGISDMVAGIGTASGSLYRASVDLLDFQIWIPVRPDFA
jgi:hypothetical protein